MSFREQSARSNAPPHSAGLQAAITSWSAALRRSALLTALLRLSTLAVAFVLAVILLDQSLPGGLPQPLIGASGWLWLVAVLVALALCTAAMLGRRLNPLYVARDIERARSITHNPVVNALLLLGAPQAEHAAGAAASQAEGALSSARSARPAELSDARRAALWLLALAAIAFGYSMASPKPVWVSLARMFSAELAAPTATQIELLAPGPDHAAYVGEPLEFHVRVSGRHVESVRLEVRPDAAPADGEALRRPFQRTDNGRDNREWRTLLAPHEVTADVRFRISAGDAALEGRVETRQQPRQESLAIRVAPPAYIGPPYDADPQSGLAVWQGSTATLRLAANTPLREPIFGLSADHAAAALPATRTRMRIAPDDPTAAELTLPLTESGAFWVEFTDRWGRAAEPSIPRRLVVRPDEPPEIALVVPDPAYIPDGRVDVELTPWLRVSAFDDIQLDAVELVLEQDGDMRRIPVLSAPLRSATPAEFAVATGDLNVPLGAQIRAWFEARDNRHLPGVSGAMPERIAGTPAPQTARTRDFLLVREPPPPPPPSLEADLPLDMPDTENGVGDEFADRQGDNGDPAGEGGGENGGIGDDGHGMDNGEPGPDDAAPGSTPSRQPGDQDGPGDGDQPDSSGTPADSGEQGQTPDADADTNDNGGSTDDAPANGAAGEPADAESDYADGDASAATGAPASGDHDAESAPGGAETDLEDRIRDFEREYGEDLERIRERLDEAPGSSAEPRDEDDAFDGEAADGGDADPTDTRRDLVLELLDRVDEIDEQDLDDLDWPDEKRSAFLRDLERLRATLERIGGGDTAVATLPSAEIGDDEIREAARGDDLSFDASAVDTYESGIPIIAPPPEQRVPPHLRAVLDAYYRAMARLRDAADADSAP